MTALLVIEGYLNMHYRRDGLFPHSLRQRPRSRACARPNRDTRAYTCGCIKDDSGELLKHALKKKKKSAAFLSRCLLNGIVSLHFTLAPPPTLSLSPSPSPPPPAQPPPPTPFFFPLFLTNEHKHTHNKNNKYTRARARADLLR